VSLLRSSADRIAWERMSSRSRITLRTFGPPCSFGHHTIVSRGFFAALGVENHDVKFLPAR
jgi:hypothetical protein